MGGGRGCGGWGRKLSNHQINPFYYAAKPSGSANTGETDLSHHFNYVAAMAYLD